MLFRRAVEERADAGHEESSAPRASFACTRDVVTHVVLLCPVSHVNLLLRPRAAEGRDEEVEEGREREAYVGSGECCAWIEVSVPWSKRIIQTPPPSASTLLFLFRDSLPCPSLPLGSASIYPSLVVVRARPACLSRSPLAALRDIWIVGSHLPHYHTNRLARSLGHSLHPVP